MSEQPLIDLTQQKIIELANETQFVPNGVASRLVLKTDNARVVLFGFDVGQELTEHTNPNHAMIQILTGACEFTLDGKPHQMKAGDFLYMPPQLPHGVKATEKFSMLLTLSYVSKSEQ